MSGVSQLELVYALLTVSVALAVGSTALLDQCRLRDVCLAEGKCARTDSALGQISMEIIPATDYGAGAGYSLFDHNIACAQWIRALWADVRRSVPAGA